MVEKTILFELFDKWGVGKAADVLNIYYTGQIFLVKTADGRKYIMKQKKDIDRILPECLLLSVLGRMKLPVPVPFEGKKGEYCFETGGRYYCLYPYIAGAVSKHFYADGAAGRAYLYGRTIALLHQGMEKCGSIQGFGRLDLPEEVSGVSLPVVMKNSSHGDARIAAVIAGTLIDGWGRFTDILPSQLIHRDMHPLNFLFDKNDRIIGIVDFDSVARGVRVFDPCYCSAYILLNGFDDQVKRHKWSELLNLLIKGYESAVCMTHVEKNAFFYGMLSALFILDAAFFKVNNTRLAAKALQVIFWMHENRRMIERTILGN